MDFTGQTALVTGASSGIGAAFAVNLAQQGVRIIATARRESRLRGLVDQLPGSGHRYVLADLAAPDGPAALTAELEAAGEVVDVLINNAGFAIHGAFPGDDPGRMVAEVNLNVTALVDLTARLLPGMVDRGHGAIINVASTAAFQPLPYMAVYGATKAFVLSFSEALWGELSDSGVRVLALCPGATDTEFFDIAGEAASVGKRQSPDEVVATALRALDRRRPSVVSGRSNAASTLLPRLLPRATTVGVTRRLLAPEGAR